MIASITKPKGENDPITFETLPPEIRLKIYQSLINDIIQNSQPDEELPTPEDRRAELAVMHTSKKVYNEFRHSLCSQLPISIDIGYEASRDPGTYRVYICENFLGRDNVSLIQSG